MNPTQFEWIKTELKRAFYEQNSFSGKLVIIENVFWFNPRAFTFSERESVFSGRRFRTAGSIFKKSRGSLEKVSGEGVWANLSRWITFQRLWLDPRGRERVAGRNRAAVAAPWPETRRSSSISQIRALESKRKTLGERGGLRELTQLLLGSRRSSGRIRRWRMAAGGSLHQFGGH